MQRVLETELMEDAGQVIAYAKADFKIPHNQFIKRIKELVKDTKFQGHALDLGCGPADISCRFAKAFPLCKIDAVDGSKPMLEYAQTTVGTDLQTRIKFVHGKLPDAKLPELQYEIILSNSLLHHLPDPHVLWDTIKKYSKPGTRIAIMDLLRPRSDYMAKTMVEMYAAAEPKILQQDFYNSFLAAFSFDEIKTQLAEAGLTLTAEQISDRHVFISGIAT